MSIWLLIILVIGLSVTFGDFPSRFLKYSFHISIYSTWLVAFSLALEVPFLLLTSFNVCQAFRNCLSLSEFQILLILPGMYSIFSFWYVLISSLCTFLSFRASVLVGFLLSLRDDVFMSHFFVTAKVFGGTLFSS